MSPENVPYRASAFMSSVPPAIVVPPEKVFEPVSRQRARTDFDQLPRRPALLPVVSEMTPKNGEGLVPSFPIVSVAFRALLLLTLPASR